jgi:hypothetical protein
MAIRRETRRDILIDGAHGDITSGTPQLPPDRDMGGWFDAVRFGNIGREMQYGG